MGLTYDRDGYTFCAFTERQADDLRSWYSCQYTQGETDRETEVYFCKVRKEDGGCGIHRQEGGKAVGA